MVDWDDPNWGGQVYMATGGGIDAESAQPEVLANR